MLKNIKLMIDQKLFFNLYIESISPSFTFSISFMQDRFSVNPKNTKSIGEKNISIDIFAINKAVIARIIIGRAPTMAV